jgi:hypothetical protein
LATALKPAIPRPFRETSEMKGAHHHDEKRRSSFYPSALPFFILKNVLPPLLITAPQRARVAALVF